MHISNMAAGTITASLHSVDNSLKSSNNNLSAKLAKNLNSPSNGLESCGKSSSKDGMKTSASTGKKRARSSLAGDSSPELMRCKRRISFTNIGSSNASNDGFNLGQPTSVARRNERERNRVKLVNMGFATLREHVPNGSKNKKMSKVDTLRSAVEYIRKLQQLLNDEDDIDDEDDDDDDEEEEQHGESRNVIGGSTSDLGSPYTDSTVDSPAVISAAENLPPIFHLHQLHHSANTQPIIHHRNIHHMDSFNGNISANVQCSASVSPTCSISSSPSPSHASDYSSYEPLSPEEEDLLDFTSWFT